MSIEKLKLENSILKMENAYYKRRLASFTGGKSEPGKEFLKRTNAERNSGYAGYLKSAINMSAAADVCSKIFFALQGGATVAVAVIAALLILPTAFVLSLLGAIIASFSRRHCRKRFESLTGTVYIVFDDVKGGYAEELKQNGTLMCVTGSIFKCGFLSASKPKDRKCYLHISFAFSLVKSLKNNKNVRIIEIF